LLILLENWYRLIPEDLHKRIVRCILQAHHLEIVVPPGSNTTNALQAVLISFVSFVASKMKIASSSPPSPASPMVLVVCIDTIAVERHCAAAKLLGRDVEGLELGQMDHHDSLSVDLVQARTCMNRPLWITTLARLGILLQHQVLSLERLSILVLDLRHSPQLNHHTVAELEPVISSLAPHVQLVMLLSLNARVSPALSSLVNGKMEASIRINLNLCSSTPSLSASSLSPTPSQPFSHILTPPSALSTNPTHLKADYQGKNQAQSILHHNLERHRTQYA